MLRGGSYWIHYWVAGLIDVGRQRASDTYKKSPPRKPRAFLAIRTPDPTDGAGSVLMSSVIVIKNKS